MNSLFALSFWLYWNCLLLWGIAFSDWIKVGTVLYYRCPLGDVTGVMDFSADSAMMPLVYLSCGLFGSTGTKRYTVLTAVTEGHQRSEAAFSCEVGGDRITTCAS
jgi:hypothetical protein